MILLMAQGEAHYGCAIATTTAPMEDVVKALRRLGYDVNDGVDRTYGRRDLDHRSEHQTIMARFAPDGMSHQPVPVVIDDSGFAADDRGALIQLLKAI